MGALRKPPSPLNHKRLRVWCRWDDDLTLGHALCRITEGSPREKLQIGWLERPPQVHHRPHASEKRAHTFLPIGPPPQGAVPRLIRPQLNRLNHGERP